MKKQLLLAAILLGVVMTASAQTQPRVPDVSSTMGLLGMACTGLALLAAKFRK
jgi:hypothetical protein